METRPTISMRTAAFIAGFPLMLFVAPYGEFYVFGKLLIYNDAAKTTQNIIDNPKLFLSGIFAMLFVFMYDVLMSWGLYIFLRPVNDMLSMLTAWFRLIYSAAAIFALFNLLYAYHMATLPGIEEVYRDQQVMELVNARRFGMNLAYVVFGVYLILVGFLIIKASYIPTWLGIIMMTAGVSWIMISLKPYFFKGYNFSWLMLLGIGELFFYFWLLIWGTRIKGFDNTGTNLEN